MSARKNTYGRTPWHKTAAFLSSLFGGIILILCTVIAKLKENPFQSVDWLGEPPGMQIDHRYSLFPWLGEFIEWEDLKKELWEEVLTNIDGIDRNELTLKLTDNNGKKNSIIQIIRIRDSIDVAHIWLGWNPWRNNHDGLIRVGRWEGQQELWTTFQRHTNNKYYLVEDKNVPDSVKVFLSPNGRILRSIE